MLLIRLWEGGWKTRYYTSKFGVDDDDVEFRKTVVCLCDKSMKQNLEIFENNCVVKFIKTSSL